MNKKLHKTLTVMIGTIDVLCLLSFLIYIILVACKIAIFTGTFSILLWVIFGINLVVALYFFIYLLMHKKR